MLQPILATLNRSTGVGLSFQKEGFDVPHRGHVKL